MASPVSGHVGMHVPPPCVREIFFSLQVIRWKKLSGLVWYYAKLLTQHYLFSRIRFGMIPGIMVRVHAKVNVFYRVTLCISAVFAVGRCLSVCLSVTFVYCIQVVEDIIKHLFRPGSPIILVFYSKRRYLIPREPRKLGCKIHGGEKNLWFSTEIAVYIIYGTR